MMRGEEPFIYDKKVLEEVCWQHAQTYLHISAMMKCLFTLLYVNISSPPTVSLQIWYRESNTGRGIAVPINNPWAFIFRFIMWTLTSILPLKILSVYWSLKRASNWIWFQLCLIWIPTAFMYLDRYRTSIPSYSGLQPKRRESKDHTAWARNQQVFF